jgi:hypothetical protein
MPTRERVPARHQQIPGGADLKPAKLIVEVTRRIGDGRLYRAQNLQFAENSTLVITDAHGQAHYIPAAMWERVEIRRLIATAQVEESQEATTS